MRLGKGTLLAGLFLLLLAAVPAAYAFDSREGDRVVIAAGEVVDDDLFVAGNIIVVNGTINGDLFAAATTVEINGTVNGDLYAGAQSVIINGTVSDDVRVAGFALELGPEAQVGDEMMAAGFSLETKAGSAVAGDVLFGGNQALLAGTLGEDALVGATGLELRGAIAGDLTAEVGTAGNAPPPEMFGFMQDLPTLPVVAGGLTLGSGATIGGDLDYSAPSEASVPVGVVGGATRFNEVVRTATEPARRGVGGWALDTIQRLLALIVVGVLVIRFAPRLTRPATASLDEQPLPSLGFGCLGLILIPIALVALFIIAVVLAVILGIITLGGLAGTVLSFGIIGVLVLFALFAFVVGYLAQIVVSEWVGRRLLGLAGAGWQERRLARFLVGAVVIVLLTAIPFFVGGLVNFVVVLLGLGALWLGWRRRVMGSMAPVAKPAPV